METFEELVRQWVAAEAAGDADRLAVLLDPDFRGDGPAGFVLSKAEWLGRHRDRELGYGALTWRTTGIRVNNHTAIGTGVLSRRAHCRGEEISTDYVCTVVATRRDDRWKIVNVQLRKASSAGSAT